MKKISLTLASTLIALGLVLAANGCKRSSEGLKVTAPSAEKNSFQEVTSHLDAGGNLYLYLSTEQFLSGVSEKVSGWRQFILSNPGIPASDRANVNKAFDTVARLIKDSGVEEISGFGMSSIATEPGVYHTKALLHHYRGEGDGFLWKVFGAKAHALDGLDLAPANTALAIFSDGDLPLTWSVILKEADQSGFPQARQFLDRVPMQFQQATGLDWDKFLNSLGGEFGVVLTLDESKPVAVPAGGAAMQIPEPGLMIAIRVKDDTLFNHIDSLIAQKLPPQAKEALIRVDENGLKMRTMPVPQMLPIELRPSLATSDGWLFLASTDALIREALAVKSGKTKGLKSTDEFRRLAKNIPTEGNSFSFCSQRFGKAIFEIQKQVMQSAAAANAAQQKWLQSLINSDKAVFSYCVGANTDEGWYSIGNGNQHPAKLLAVGAIVPAALLSAIAIPNFVKARQVSQNNSCINNLRQIDGAKQQWALENNKKSTDIPTQADLAPYLRRGVAGDSSAAFRCPQGGRYTIGPVGESPKCSVPGHALN